MADLQRIIGETETENELAAMAENFDLNAYMESRRQMVEESLTAYLDNYIDGDDNRVMEAIRYSLFAPSKRIRPILCFMACEAFGGDTRSAIPAACALEMIHTYSLIHDDLPAMDNDDMRRGQPSCHIKYDEATAILAGDALLSMAFEILGNTYTACDALADAKRWLKVISILGRGVGPVGIVDGQIMDLQSLHKALTLEELEELSYLKTAVMMIVPLEIGAALAYANEQDIKRMYDFGKYLGLAFQAVDDILDIDEDRAFAESQAGKDSPEVKNTFALLLGKDAAAQLAQGYTEQALEVLEDLGPKFDTLRIFTNFLVERKA